MDALREQTQRILAWSPVILVGLAACIGVGCASDPGLSPRSFISSSAINARSPLPANSESRSNETIQLVRLDDSAGSTKADTPELKMSETAATVAAPTQQQEQRQSVESFVDVALSNHPRILAARARVASASQRAPQVWSLDDPVLSNSFYPISDQALQTAAGRAGNQLSVTQRYPWPEKRRARAAIADRETQMAAARLNQVELEIEEMVRLAYYELWFADRAIAITESNREIALELITLAKARNQAGGSQQDVLRAQLQVDAIDDRMIGLARQKALAQADLAALIQTPGEANIEPLKELSDDSVPENLDALFAAAGECSPRLRELCCAVSRDHQKQQLACLNRYPDFTLGAGWQTITESDAISPVATGNDNFNLMFAVTLPIWREKINATIREASAEISASSLDYSAARDDTFRQIRRLAEQAYAAEEQLRIYNDRVLPRAKQALQLATAAYRGRLVDFGEVTDGFTEVLMFELQVARAEATRAGAIAQLHRAVGCEVVVAE